MTYGGSVGVGVGAAASNPMRSHFAAHEVNVRHFPHFLQVPTADAPTERDDLRKDKC
jgi:hypothetical protein